MGLSGSVQVKVLLLANGVVGSAKALSGPQQLRVVAQAVARKARFEPARVNGVPVTVTGVITYTFANPKDPTSVTTSYAKDIIGDESATVAELTSFDAAETRLKQKLQVWLYDLVEHLQVGDTTPTDKQSLFVLDGKANVSIQLKDHSPATMEKLRNAGFELVREKGKNVVTGKIAPENIAALADIDEVVLVLPQI
jgi:TonB family protein